MRSMTFEGGGRFDREAQAGRGFGQRAIRRRGLPVQPARRPGGGLDGVGIDHRRGVVAKDAP